MTILIFLILFALSYSPLQAAADFTTTHQISYQINQQGDALVHQQTSLKNNYSQIYPREYQINLKNSQVQNVVAYDSYGNIIKNLNTQTSQTTIDLKFNQPAVGKNQVTQFDLKYQIPHLAASKGNTWEIALPQHQYSSTDDQVTITVKVPLSFGRLSFCSLSNPKITTTSQNHLISLTGNQISNKKILLIFGEYQLFNFQLDYFLHNPSNQSIYTQIAIPPDTPDQNITYRRFSPQPSQITTDADGNWLANFKLDAKQEIKVTVQGQAKIMTNINPHLTSSPPPPSLLLPQKFWPVDHPQIIAAAANLNTAKDIYDFVVQKLSYNYQNINSATRQGALFALQNPAQSLCTEFTDLFIALARAKGIPARQVEGFAYTNNPKIKPTNPQADILHAWPQYYSSEQQRWLSVDPTWENTTKGIDYFHHLDLNHLAFVFHGRHSSQPLPPGSYKTQKSQKTVSVSFTRQQIEPELNSPQIRLSSPNLFGPNQLTISNPNFNSLHQINLKIPRLNWQQTIASLPPLANQQFTLPTTPFFSSLLPQNQKINLQLEFRGLNQPQQQPITNPRHSLNLIIAITSLILFLSLSGIILTVIKTKK